MSMSLDAFRVSARTHMRNPAQLYWIRYYGDYKSRVDTKARDAALASAMHSYESITRSGGTTGAVIAQAGNFAEGSVDAVGANYFDVLDPRLIAGRTFVPSDAGLANAPIVITDGLAAQLFPNGEPPVGVRITVDKTEHVIVGVVTQQSNFPHGRTMAWTVAAPVGGSERYYVRLIRLRRGATRADAERELGVIATRFAAASGENPRDVAFRFDAAADDGKHHPRRWRARLGLTPRLLGWAAIGRVHSTAVVLADHATTDCAGP